MSLQKPPTQENHPFLHGARAALLPWVGPQTYAPMTMWISKMRGAHIREREKRPPLLVCSKVHASSCKWRAWCVRARRHKIKGPPKSWAKNVRRGCVNGDDGDRAESRGKRHRRLPSTPTPHRWQALMTKQQHTRAFVGPALVLFIRAGGGRIKRRRRQKDDIQTLWWCGSPFFGFQVMLRS